MGVRGDFPASKTQFTERAHTPLLINCEVSRMDEAKRWHHWCNELAAMLFDTPGELLAGSALSGRGESEVGAEATPPPQRWAAQRPTAGCGVCWSESPDL